MSADPDRLFEQMIHDLDGNGFTEEDITGLGKYIVKIYSSVVSFFTDQTPEVRDGIVNEESDRLREGMELLLEDFINSVEGALSDARENLENLRNG